MTTAGYILVLIYLGLCLLSSIPLSIGACKSTMYFYSFGSLLQ